MNEKPDAILNIVDGTNIERNLYLTTQLAELGIPVVIALNMIDVVRKNGDVIRPAQAGRGAGLRGGGDLARLRARAAMEAAEKAAELAQGRHRKPPHVFAGSVVHALARVEHAHRPHRRSLHHHADGSCQRRIVEPSAAGTPSSSLSATRRCWRS